MADVETVIAYRGVAGVWVYTFDVNRDRLMVDRWARIDFNRVARVREVR